jgi:hypothetical protein
MTGLPEALARERRAAETRAGTSPTSHGLAPDEAPPPWLWLAAAGTVAAAFAVGLLWATQGGAVFFELVTTGLSACF